MLLRWLTEPDEPGERQHRAYRLTCGLVTRMGKFILADAGHEKEALEVVHRVRDHGRLLKEIAGRDGISHLKEPPMRPELMARYGRGYSYPMFSMLSELGAHPGAVGNFLFATPSDGSSTISFDLQAAFSARAKWSAAAVTHLWHTCQVTSAGMGWDEWLNEAREIHESAGPVLLEAVDRARAARR